MFMTNSKAFLSSVSILAILLFAQCTIRSIHGGSIALCTVIGMDGITWFYAGTTESLDTKTGSVVLSDSGSYSDGSYPFGATFTSDQFWGFNGESSELERIKAKAAAAGADEECSICDGYDVFNDVQTWQRKRLKLYDGTYTVSTSYESSVVNECENDYIWHQVFIFSQGPFAVNELCINSTHRLSIDDDTLDYIAIYDETCQTMSNCVEYDSDTGGCKTCEDGYFLVYDDYPQCFSDGTAFCEEFVEDYYGCKACSEDESNPYYMAYWSIPFTDDGLHYCVNGVPDNQTIGNDDCIAYKTCDFYGDNDCENNPNCDIQYSWGCQQCKDGYWQISVNHPCRECPAYCNDCQDYFGCQINGCEDGYEWEWDNTCGYGKCVLDEGCTDGIAECESSNCQNDDNPYCNNQYTWGCDYCQDGYFMKSHNYPCVSCEEYLPGCKSDRCSSWQGCQWGGCQDGYTFYWDNECGIGRCYQD